LKGHKFSVGSGSTYAYGVLDTHYNYNMKVDDAIELGIRSIYHATHRDTGSGGVVRGFFLLLLIINIHFIVYHIHKDGWTKVHDGLDANVLHYKFAQ
jgi:20S proteasome subunit beta 5